MPVGSYTKSDVSRLMAKHRAAIYGYIYASVRSHVDAEDIFQDVFVAVLGSISQLEEEDGFFSWVREIAFRRIMAFFRNRGREQPFNPHVVAALAEAAGYLQQHAPVSDRREALLECLDRLPKQSRELVELRYGSSGEHLEVVARYLGKSVKAIYSRLDRIRAILRECVQRRLSRESQE